MLDSPVHGGGGEYYRIYLLNLFLYIWLSLAKHYFKVTTSDDFCLQPRMILKIRQLLSAKRCVRLTSAWE
jgi:hypothetical protein